MVNGDKVTRVQTFMHKNAWHKLIKHFTLEDANYQLAKDALKKAYLDDDKIKEGIVSSIYLYRNQNPDKNYTSVIKGLTALENHIAELKNVHAINC